MPNITIITGTGSASYTVSTGARGPAGQGVPTGGTTGQVLKKTSSTDYDTAWEDDAGGDALTYAGDDPNVQFAGSYQRHITIVAGDGTNTSGLPGAIVTTAGNAQVIITSAALTGGQKTYSVALALNDTAIGIHQKIQAVLNADSALTDFYSVGILSTTVQLTNKAVDGIYPAPDPTLNIAITKGTSTGLIDDFSSVENSAGQAGYAAATASFLGQFCKASSGWWQWDGTAWIQTHTLAGAPIISDASLPIAKLATNPLNASNLSSGTVPFARLVNTQTVGDANSTINALTRDVLLTSAITAPRTYTLPAASGYPAGTRITFVDVANTITATNTVTLARAGSDTINGSTSIVLNTAGASPILISDGTSKWNLDIRGISRGGTGATTAAQARTNLGLGNVDNTSDAAKPVSTATQTALNAKQDTLVSGTNIKTINGSSVMGSGNLTVGGTVDNAAVNAAIATNPAASRAALSAAEINNDVLNSQKYCVKKMNAWVSASAPPIRMAFVGDSLCTGLAPFENMAVKGFISQGFLNTAGVSLNPQNLATNDWVNGQVVQINTGQTTQFSRYGGMDDSIQGSKAVVMWIAEPTGGAGTFDVQTRAGGSGGSWSNATGGTGLSTYNATKIAQVATFDLATSNSPSHSLRITNVSGKPVKLIAWGIYYHNSGGVIQIDGVFNKTGRDVTAWPFCPDEIFNPVWTALDADLVMSCWADSYRNWGPINPTPDATGSVAPSNPQIDSTWLNTGDSITYFWAGNTLQWQKCGQWRVQYDRMKALKSATDFVQLSAHPLYAPEWSGYANWATGTAYSIGDKVFRDPSDGVTAAENYICTSAHTSGSTTAPGTGASWATRWAVYYSSEADAASITAVRNQIIAQRDWAALTNESAIALYGIFTSHVAAVAAGMKADNAHLSSDGQKLRNVYLNHKVPLATVPIGRLGGGNSLGGMFSISVPGNEFVSGGVEIDRNFSVNGGATSTLQVMARDAGLDRAARLGVYANAETVYFQWRGGNIAEMRSSSRRGWWPSNNDSMLGGDTLRWRGCFGGIIKGYASTTTNYTLGTTDYTINVTANSVNVTLPAASTTDTNAGYTGRIYQIVNKGAGTVTVVGTVDGVTNPTIAAGGKIIVQSTGSAWIQL